MRAPVVGRHDESQAVADFLDSVAAGPAALVVEGEAGIGKTTVWLAALERAAELGFRVLSARTSSAESVQAYAALAGLLTGLDDSSFAHLPPPQRLAIDRVLLRVSADGPMTDQRAVTAGFLSVVDHLAEESRVLVAIDDLQWLDQASSLVVSSAVRRISGPVGVLATTRTGPDSGPAAGVLELRRPERMNRVRVRPLSVGALHNVLSERLGRSFSRPKMMHIHEVSGGNPFYALELARVMDDHRPGEATSLPNTLTELVRARIGGLAAEAREALLAAACVAEPTVELIARANSTDGARILSVLEEAEDEGIVEIDGHRLHFAHPLLSRGVYSDATPASRRAMHRRLAELIEEPELKARHLARAAVSGDERTLASLDEAAQSARIRGAPAAAAELLELALRLGGDTPERRIRLAGNYFDAGDPNRSRTLLQETVEQLAPGALHAEALTLLAVVRLYGDGFQEAAALLELALREVGDNLAARVRMLVTLSFARVNCGRHGAAMESIEDAVMHATRLGESHLLGLALGMRVILRFMVGDGVDEAGMRRALELEDPGADTPIALRPSVQNALLLAWTGELDGAHEAVGAIRRRCIERGEEGEWIFVAFNSVMVEIWRGNFAEARLLTDDVTERALQLNGAFPMFVALTCRAALGSYLGPVEDARRDAARALAAGRRGGSYIMASPIISLGFIELSLGNYDAAIATFEPLLANVRTAPREMEIISASFVPDATEALIQLRRLAEAETADRCARTQRSPT